MGGTTTSLPIFAEDPDHKNVIVALVANGRGMCLGANAGRLVKGLVLGKAKLDNETRNFLDFCLLPKDHDEHVMKELRQLVASRYNLN